jgi:hypothetical protein
MSFGKSFSQINYVASFITFLFLVSVIASSSPLMPTRKMNSNSLLWHGITLWKLCYMLFLDFIMFNCMNEGLGQYFYDLFENNLVFEMHI